MGQTLATQLKGRYHDIKSELKRDQPLDAKTTNKFIEFVRAYPQSLWWKDQHGETLMMVLFYYLTGALERQESLDQFRSLITPQTSQVIVMQNAFGWTLLHHACRHAPNNLEIISFLLEQRPIAAKVLNQWKQTPLHIACIHKASLEVIQRLVRSCPQSARACDVEGQTPLHDACKHGSPPCPVRRKTWLHVIQFLAMTEVTVCLTPDEDGDMPLDLAPKCFKKDQDAINFLTTVTNAAAGAVADQLCKDSAAASAADGGEGDNNGSGDDGANIPGPPVAFLKRALSSNEISKNEIYAMTRRDDVRSSILARMSTAPRA